MFGVYQITTYATTPIDLTIAYRASFTTEFLAKEWADIKAKKEYSSILFTVLDLKSGEVIHQVQGARQLKTPMYPDEPRETLIGKVDIQA